MVPPSMDTDRCVGPLARFSPLLPHLSITPRKVTVVCQIQRELLTSRNRSLPREERTVCSSPLAFPGIPLRRRREAERRGPSEACGGFLASLQRRQPQRGRSPPL